MRYKLSTIFCIIAILCAVVAFPQPSQSEETFTREYWVSSSDDDAEEWTTGVDTGVVTTTNIDLDLEVGFIVGLRFQGVQVPRGVTITSAYIKFIPEDSDDNFPYEQTIYGEATDNAAEFVRDTNNISGRTRTSASVTWADDTSWVTHDAGHDTDDISSIIQEIIDRPGWVPGNSMAFIFVPVTGERDAWSYDGSYLKRPLLHITAACSDPSSVPLGAIKHAAPANIMFVLDDSGSMDWEFLTEDKTNEGKFQEYYYLTSPGDNVFTSTSAYILGGVDLRKWKSQWAGYNKIYYDPSVDYQPWTTVAGMETPANPDNPRSHPIDPIEGNRFPLSGTYYSFAKGIVVDDLDPGSFITTGPWNEFSGHHESYKNHFWYSSSSGDHTATWTPNVPPGDYYVYAWWRSHADYSTAVPYKIDYSGGSTTITVDQRINERQWNLIGGPYAFTGDSAENVTISYTPSGSGTDLACADAVKFVRADTPVIDIKNAHYYVYSTIEGKPYLVNLPFNTDDPSPPPHIITYYGAIISGTDEDEVIDSLTLTPAPPADVQSTRSYTDERQNFANWYSFYRRRELTATAAVANAIANMQGVNVGLYSINGNLKQSVLKVKAQGEDQSATLLNKLYGLTISDQISPLRQGLEDVGRYFDKDDNIKLDGNFGDDSPWASVDDGGACQQAFAIVTSTGYWNGSYSGVGNADGDNGDPYADSYLNTLADVAMYYYEGGPENDLATTLEDSVTTNPADDNTKQHMVTYTVGFGLSGTLIRSEYDLESGPFPTWPNPDSGSKEKIDDLWHAAVNGRGEYLSVFNSGELVDALLAIKQNIEARTGSAAPVSVNGVELYEEVGPQLYMFQSTYNTNGWTGDVKAYKVNPTTGEVSETPEWSAADNLDAMWWTNRKIATYTGAAAVPFVYLNLTPEQQQQLDPDETTAKNILKFLRGDRLLEGGAFRDRFSVLGDIVHSSPVFENGVLYTGANDGMLHAFSATTGSEIFAYIPNLVFENLKDLADPTFHGNHTYYVDLSPVIQTGVDQGASTMTLLVGGLGKGGKGYYALDITGINASTVFASDGNVDDRVLWEYPNSSTPIAEINDVGYSYTRPVIVDSNDGDLNADGTGWIVIVGNGYNSENGKAVLLILDPSDGTVLKRIDTGVGSCNGLSTPVAIDVDYDDRVDYVYAGDLRGNLWKFDLTNPDYTQWGVAYDDGVGNPQPLFQALGQPITTKPDVMRHPERHGYIVVFGTGKYLASTDYKDHSVNTIYGIWDYGDDSDDGEYLGFFNRESATTKLSNQPDTVTLLEQQIIRDDENDSNFWTKGENKLRILTDNPPNWTTTTDPDDPGHIPDPVANVGWYFDLPLTGERVVTDVMIRDAKAIVITFTPEEAPCSIGGDSIVHEMDAASGGRLLAAQFDIGGAAAIDADDLINIGTEASPEWVAPTGIQKTGRLHAPAILRMGSTEMKYFSSSEGTIKRVREKPPKVGVRYWRELE